MDIFFHDPADAPVPPEDVRIRELTATPYPDGRRVKIYIELIPFLKRPSGEVLLKNAEGRIIASANIIETMTHKMELTLHIRGAAPEGECRACVDLFYQDVPDDNASVEPEGEIQLPERKRVDYSEISFSIPSS